MELNIQIYSFIYSFLFGIFLNSIYMLFNKLVWKTKMIIRFIISLGFMIIMTLSYFIGLLWINNGIVHIYFLLCLSLGMLFSKWIKKRWLTHLRKN